MITMTNSQKERKKMQKKKDSQAFLLSHPDYNALWSVEYERRELETKELYINPNLGGL